MNDQSTMRPPDQKRSGSKPGQGNRKPSWPYLAGGGVLIFAGIRRGILRGLLLTGAGAAVAYRGLKGQWPVVGGQPGDPSIHATLTINRPAEELYDLWRDLESLPQLIPHVEEVAAHGTESKWVASTELGGELKWKAVITHEDRPHRIEWKSANGSPLPMTGFVQFREPPGDRGTEVRVEIVPDPPGGKVGAKLAGALAKLPEQQLRRDLKRLKQQLEAGEVATTQDQPRGNGTSKMESEGTSR